MKEFRVKVFKYEMMRISSSFRKKELHSNMVLHMTLITLDLVNIKEFSIWRTKRHAMNMQGDRRHSRCSVLRHITLYS